MGWRSKILLLLIVYFAGFATAIYHLAPAGPNDCQAAGYSSASGQRQSRTAGVFDRFYDKAVSKTYPGLSGMDSKDFKEHFNRGLRALRDMAKTSQATGGGEDK